jgi:hypothetical protein
VASKVFFSWQSDTPNRVGRTFLETALTAALAVLAQDGELEEADRDLELDRDTKGVAGSPPLVDTIFGKIDEAAAVVCDMTFVSSRAGGKRSPNPNVLIEYGWALKSRGHERLISVMNAAYGAPSEVTLPFDMRHLRFPITYDLPHDAAADKKGTELKRLTLTLADALKPILTKATVPETPRLFVPRPSGKTPGRWQGADTHLGFLGSSTVQVVAPQEALMWFRMWPELDQGRCWSIADIRAAIWHSYVARPFIAPEGGFDAFREDGVFGTVSVGAGDDRQTGFWSTAMFESGEIWGIDGFRMDRDKSRIYFDPERWAESAGQYWDRLNAIGVQGPLMWEAGFENCRGRLFASGRAPSVKNTIVVNGRWDGGRTETVKQKIWSSLLESTR